MREEPLVIHDDMLDRFGGQVEIVVVESEGRCECAATISTKRGSFTGHGDAVRHPNDPVVPMIGEELAIGRALRDLSSKLILAATEAIEEKESRPIHFLDAT